jgi:hypothetical protein
MLEPYAGKLARTVLRGPGGSKDFSGHPPVCTENLNPNVVVVEPAEKRV